jgi:hypothetical protein
MSSTPTFEFDHLIDYSIPPSPTFPPVPRVSLASSISSLHSLYEQDGQRTPSSEYHQYTTTTTTTTAGYYSEQFYMSHNNKSTGTLFTDDDLAKAFQDRVTVSPRSSPNRSVMAHDVSDPSSPWKRSIRVRYSDVNMRDRNSMALQEASDLLARDMASYVPSPQPPTPIQPLVTFPCTIVKSLYEGLMIGEFRGGRESGEGVASGKD